MSYYDHEVPATPMRSMWATKNAYALFRGYTLLSNFDRETDESNGSPHSPRRTSQHELEEQTQHMDKQHEATWWHHNQEALDYDNIWTKPIDHRDRVSYVRRGLWLMISILHCIVLFLAVYMVFRLGINSDTPLTMASDETLYVFSLALACMTTDIGIVGIVFLLYGITYALGGNMGVRTTTGIISLLIDSLQTIAYDIIALSAWTIAGLTWQTRLEAMDHSPTNEFIPWVVELKDLLIDAIREDWTKSTFLITVIFLGTFYLIYSANTFLGILAFTYKTLFPQVIPLVEFFNPSSRLAYVYLTGPQPYLQSLYRLNKNFKDATAPHPPSPTGRTLPLIASSQGGRRSVGDAQAMAFRSRPSFGLPKPSQPSSVLHQGIPLHSSAIFEVDELKEGHSSLGSSILTRMTGLFHSTMSAESDNHDNVNTFVDKDKDRNTKSPRSSQATFNPSRQQDRKKKKKPKS